MSLTGAKIVYPDSHCAQDEWSATMTRMTLSEIISHMYMGRSGAVCVMWRPVEANIRQICPSLL